MNGDNNFPIWHQMNADGNEWDVWKGETLMAIIRTTVDISMVTLRDGTTKGFMHLGDCIVWTSLQVWGMPDE